MRALVTGAAGFIGSQLCVALLDAGATVVGVDAFTPSYDRRQKLANVDDLLQREGFELTDADLTNCDLNRMLDGTDTVFHLAALPGVRQSWADGFASYLANNVLATQRLLDACLRWPFIRFVFASSSSVYGNAPAYPVTEDAPTNPHSPYGASKLAAEHLVRIYAENHGLSTASLRYFSVYGPRQRPDMGVHRMIEAALTGKPFPLYGRGDQIRDMTYVGDIVAATIAAAHAPEGHGLVCNVAGGDSVTMRELLDAVRRLSGRELVVEERPEQPGDVARTGGSIERATSILGWRPAVSFEDGLARQIDWHAARHAAHGR